MKCFNQPPFPIGVYTGSCGKREMLDHDLKKLQEQQMNIVIVDPQKELEALLSFDEKNGNEQ
nr:hypothetical protein [uncultured Dysosmobacter sp.]